MSTNHEYDSEQEYAFLEETIKDKAYHKKKSKNTMLKIVAFGLLFGIAASIGFYAVKPLAESMFGKETKKVKEEQEGVDATTGTSEGDSEEQAKNSYIGLSGEMVTEQISTEHQIPMGLYVTDVKADSPAMRAGIQRGDVITEMDGMEIQDLITFHSKVLEAKIGSVLRMTGKRLGATEYVELEFRVIVEQE